MHRQAVILALVGLSFASASLVQAAKLQTASSATSKSPLAESWYVGLDDQNYCALVNQYEGSGSTKLILMSPEDDRVIVSATNSNWTATKGQTYALIVALDEWRRPVQAWGYKAGHETGFLFGAPEGFLDQFAKATRLRIFKEDVIVDDLSLQGSSEGLDRLIHCALTARRIPPAQPPPNPPGVPLNPFAQPEAKPAHDAEPKIGQSRE